MVLLDSALRLASGAARTQPIDVPTSLRKEDGCVVLHDHRGRSAVDLLPAIRIMERWCTPPQAVAVHGQGPERLQPFAGRYVNESNRKWLSANPAGESLLGTADIQSLADPSNSVSIVRDMRLVPVSPSMLMYLAMAALLPLLPLALFKCPSRTCSRNSSGGWPTCDHCRSRLPVLGLRRRTDHVE
jgi:hypothetical protein